MAYPKGLKAKKIPLHELTLAVGRKEILAKVEKEGKKRNKVGLGRDSNPEGRELGPRRNSWRLTMEQLLGMQMRMK